MTLDSPTIERSLWSGMLIDGSARPALSQGIVITAPTLTDHNQTCSETGCTNPVGAISLGSATDISIEGGTIAGYRGVWMVDDASRSIRSLRLVDITTALDWSSSTDRWNHSFAFRGIVPEVESGCFSLQGEGSPADLGFRAPSGSVFEDTASKNWYQKTSGWSSSGDYDWETISKSGSPCP